MTKMVSIIVPLYNAENHLGNCVNSILNQTYKHIEIILVNDGSTDNSGRISEDFATTDNRIKVIHQKNAGPSSARNTGINTAVGDYIQFVDADDYIEATMTEKLVEAMDKNVQLVICGYNTIFRNKDNLITNKYIPSLEGVYEKAAFMAHFGELYKDIILPSPCNKLYVTDMINRFNIRFIKNLTMGEDLLFNLDYMKTCNNISVITDTLYNYLIDDFNSLSRGFQKDFLVNQQMLFRKLKEFLLENNCYTGQNKHLLNIVYTTSIVNAIGNLFHKNSVFTSKQKKDQISTIVTDDYLKQNIAYFNDSIQKRLIGLMIKHESINGIYGFFKIKSLLQYKMYPLFHLLKKINKK